MNFCRKCGSCCRAIPLSIDLTRYYLGDYEENLKLLCDGEIMIPNFIPISRDKAVEINPRLAHCIDGRTSDDGEGIFFYTCRLLDERTNECMIHHSSAKPKCCSEFPWYGKIPYNCTTCAEGCGFLEYYELITSFARLDPKIFLKGILNNG